MHPLPFYDPPCHLKVRRAIALIYIFNIDLEIEVSREEAYYNASYHQLLMH